MPVFSKKIFAQKVREELGRRGWSQADLARKAGVKPQLLSTWLKEKSKISSKNLHRIVNTLGVSVEQLTGVQTETSKSEDIQAILGQEHKVLLAVLEKSFAANLDERMKVLEDLRDRIIHLTSLLEKVIKYQQKGEKELEEDK